MQLGKNLKKITMKQIEPVSLWVNGRIKIANTIDIKSVNDNLEDSAVFYYSLVAESQENGSTSSESLAQGNLNIQGQDYINWGIQTDINEWAYQWAATQLNLILVPEVTTEG